MERVEWARYATNPVSSVSSDREALDCALIYHLRSFNEGTAPHYTGPLRVS